MPRLQRNVQGKAQAVAHDMKRGGHREETRGATCRDVRTRQGRWSYVDIHVTEVGRLGELGTGHAVPTPDARHAMAVPSCALSELRARTAMCPHTDV